MLAKYRAWYNDGTPDGYFVYWTSQQINDPLADFAGDYESFSDFIILEYVGDSGSSFETSTTWDVGLAEGDLVYIDGSSVAKLADTSSPYTSEVKGIASSLNRIKLGGICTVKLSLVNPITLTIGQKLYLSQTVPGSAAELVTYNFGDIITEIGFSLENTALGAMTCSIMFHPLAPVIVDDTILVQVQ